jgi:hypothetical protein
MTTAILLYVFFWVISRRLNFICRRFGTFYLFHLHGQVGVVILHLHDYEDGTDSVPETSAYKVQTPENYPEENIQHKEHSESLKSRKLLFCVYVIYFRSVFARR